MTSENKIDLFITSQLNEAQKEAVTHTVGPLLVIAGAGSGKTRIITARISYLMMHQGVTSDAIVGLTFTNKAAHEMKERIAHFLPKHTPLPFVGTFHSYCVRFLRTYGHVIDLPVFSILDEDDQKKIINDLLKQSVLQKKVTYKTVLHYISQQKQRYQVVQSSVHNDPLHEIFIHYEREKRAAKCLDFDDLLYETVALLKKFPSIQMVHQNLVRHILIDEYQDTNHIQQELLTLLSQHEGCLTIDSMCAVGDEDQAIYSWRGATVTNILNFNTTFSNTRLVKIEQNYRSVEPILSLANTIIGHNTLRTPKQLWSSKKAQDRVRLVACASEYQESELIGAYIEVARKKQALSSIAILYRMHIQSRAIEEELVKRSIPYKIIGGLQFYERREIKDLIAYVRVISNHFDRSALIRIFNVPTRGLGAKCEELLKEVWETQPFCSHSELLHVLLHDLQNGLNRSQREGIAHLIAILNGVDRTVAPSKALEQILSKTNYIGFLRETCEPQEAEERIDNIYELLDAAHHFESQTSGTIEQFLHEVGLMQEIASTKKGEQEAVLLMSIHAAKGLEFDTVIVCGLEEGIMPSSRAQQTAEIEEERRLLYVAITRAQERLMITYARNRYTYGTVNHQIPSRFIDEMVPYKNQVHPVSYLNRHQLLSFCAQWLGYELPSCSYEVQTVSARIKNNGDRNHSILSTSSARRTPRSYGHQLGDTVPVERVSLVRSTDAIVSVLQKVQQQVGLGSCVSVGKRVRHATYGIGTVKGVEERGGTVFATVLFSAGSKKIKASFLELIAS